MEGLASLEGCFRSFRQLAIYPRGVEKYVPTQFQVGNVVAKGPSSQPTRGWWQVLSTGAERTVSKGGSPKERTLC